MSNPETCLREVKVGIRTQLSLHGCKCRPTWPQEDETTLVVVEVSVALAWHYSKVSWEAEQMGQVLQNDHVCVLQAGRDRGETVVQKVHCSLRTQSLWPKMAAIQPLGHSNWVPRQCYHFLG